MKTTKKLILIIMVVIGMINVSFAQDNKDSREELKFGIKGGLNLSNVYDTQGENFVADSKLGFVFGGFIAIPLGKFIGIQPEILFSQKGYKRTGNLLGILPYEFKHTTSYIDIPIFFAVKPIASLTIMAGPQFSFLVKQSDSFTSSILTTVQEEEFKNNNIRKNTLGFIWGADLNLSSLVIGGRVGWDLSDNNGDGTSTNPRYKNVWYQLTLGFRF